MGSERVPMLISTALTGPLSENSAKNSMANAEAVFLAGLPNAPSLYASSPELALKRTQTVLKRMVKCLSLIHI